MDTEQFISNAAAELEMVEAQLRDIETRAAALRVRSDGLRFLIQYGREARGDTHPQAPAVVAGDAGESSATEIAQTDRVLRAMAQIGRAGMTGEITDKVNALDPEHPMSHEKVRSALGYLVRKKPPCVERVRPGVWRLPKAAPSPAAFTPTLLTVAASNGHGSRGES